MSQRFTVVVEPSGWIFSAAPPQTLLQAAAQGGIALPSSCRNGTCRTCICCCLAGQVRYRIEWPGLSAEEKRDGFILPCVAYPLTDLTIAVPYAKRLDEGAAPKR